MSERTKDYLALAMAVSSPIGIAVGVLLLIVGPTWLGTFLLFFGLASSPGCFRLLWEMYRHGIHNKHFCGGADCHGYTGRY